MKLWCATTNSGKLREFRLAAEKLGRGGFDIEPIPGLAAITPPEEYGATFEDNAVIKALCYSRHAPGLLFAEDSGIESLALRGAPGVHSARFAGPGATDDDNNRLLLAKLEGIKPRAGRYVCVAAVAKKGTPVRTFRGVVDGRILEAPRGSNGFGYDPLFFYPPFGRTFAELSLERKLLVSHRGRALADMFRWLRENGTE